MAKHKKMWIYSPRKKPGDKPSDLLKDELTEKANQLIENKLKPWRVKMDQSAKVHGFNYVVDMYTIWWRHYFYFCAKYHNPDPNALQEYFEDRFTRMEYVRDRSFNLAYMRHTGQWWEVFQELSLEECLEAIEKEQIFWP